MNATNLIKIALKATSNNKTRAFLTMLGIIIGVASVITMLAIGQGSKENIRSQISEMGSNLIIIRPGGIVLNGVRQSGETMESLKMEDYKSLVEETRYLSAISPSVNSNGQSVYGVNNTPTAMYGVNRDYLDINRHTIDEGMMFSEQEINTAAKVCVIGTTVAKALFPNGEDPVGKVIRFNKIPFRIVGLLESKGYNSMGMDQDDLILAPFTTVQKRLLAISHLQGINASAVSEEYTQQAIAEVTELFRRNHRLNGEEEDDFRIQSMEEMISTISGVMDMLTILLGAVAGISLVVGGIGIMNIMYVSVTERTREIGLRMSIGAKGSDILSQFLIEAILISLTGGVIGVVAGGGLSAAIAAFSTFQTTVQWWSVALSFAVCTFTGVFFGWYPARKAAHLDPIEAIRYE
jgi:putative ABC transport system permease protein